MNNPDDFPFDKVLAEANELLENPGVNLFQKFTCQGCGNRLTIEEPNTFYTSGKCDQCGHVSDIRKHGCNYLVVARLGPDPA